MKSLRYATSWLLRLGTSEFCIRLIQCSPETVKFVFYVILCPVLFFQLTLQALQREVRCGDPTLLVGAMRILLKIKNQKSGLLNASSLRVSSISSASLRTLD